MEKKNGLLIRGSAVSEAVGEVEPDQIDLKLCEKNGIPPVMVSSQVQLTNISGFKLAAIVTALEDTFEQDGAIMVTVFPTAAKPFIPGVRVKFSRDGVSQGWVIPNHKTKRLKKTSVLMPPQNLH
jgi:hypothetical protein